MKQRENYDITILNIFGNIDINGDQYNIIYDEIFDYVVDVYRETNCMKQTTKLTLRTKNKLSRIAAIITMTLCERNNILKNLTSDMNEMINEY